MATDKDLLDEAREQFKEADEAWNDNRQNFLEDIKFARLAQQWPEAVKRQRELENRPCLTVNRLPAFIRQVVNDARQNKPAIKVHPADDKADPGTAQVMNGLIRNIEYTSKSDVAYDTALESAVSGGFGFFRIDVDYARDDSFDMDILFKRVANPLTVYGDPHSTEADSSDWNRAFVTELIKKEEFEVRWKGADKVNWQADGYDQLNSHWMTGDEVRIAEWWTRDDVERTILRLTNGEILAADHFEKPEVKAVFDALGITVAGDRIVKSWKVTQRIITGAEVLETNAWAGRFIPIIPVYGDEVNVEGVRHFRSLVRDAIDPQRMFNYWRTAATELVALAPKAPWIGPKGAFKSDARKWNSANTASHSFLEYDGQVPPQRQPFAGVPAGALQEALNASDDMKSIMGIFDASLGARSNETSGRAIMARQREGDVSTFHFIDNLSRAIKHAGCILIDLIPHVYSQPRIVRIMGADKQPQNVAINQKYQGPDGSEQIHDLTVGKYDLTVDVGPSFTTKRQEATEQMLELIRVFPPAAQVVGDLLAKNQDWPEADEIARRLQALLPPQLQGQNPQAQQLQQQMQQLDQQAKQAIGTLQQQLQAVGRQLEEAKSKSDNDKRKLDIEEFKALTDRIEALTTAAGQGNILAQQALVQMAQQAPELFQQSQPMPAIPQHFQQQQQPPQGGFPPSGASPQSTPFSSPTQ